MLALKPGLEIDTRFCFHLVLQAVILPCATSGYEIPTYRALPKAELQCAVGRNPVIKPVLNGLSHAANCISD